MLTRGTALAVGGGSLLGAVVALLSRGMWLVDPDAAEPFTPVNALPHRAPPAWRETPRFTRQEAAGVASAGSKTADRVGDDRADGGAGGRNQKGEQHESPAPMSAAAGDAAASPPTAREEGAAAEPSAQGSAEPSAKASAAPAGTFPHWEPLNAPPANQEDLMPLLVRCGQRDGRSCLAAGIAYAEGFGAGKDSKEADRFFRIALNFLGRHCEQRDAGACVDLAEMYRRGIVVAEDSARARVLIERARELCKIHATSACSDVPRD